ncbi:MAG: ComEC/Rec2 family competence protein [Actinomycetota bacterium]
MSAGSVFALCISYALGVVVVDRVPASLQLGAGLGALSFVLLAAGSRARKRTRGGALALSALVFLGGSLAALRLASLRSSETLHAAAQHAHARLDGSILDQPSIVNQQLKFTMGVSSAVVDRVTYAIRERVAVSIRPPPSTIPSLESGDRISLDARLANFRSATAKDRDFASRERQRGVAVEAFAQPDSMVVLGHARNPIGMIANAGSHAISNESGSLPPRERGVFASVLLGDHSGLDPTTKTDFQLTGLSHLLAVDGLKFAIFLGSILMLLRLVNAGLRMRLTVSVIVTIAFMALTRFEPSVIRAGAMTLIAIVALGIGARRNARHTLGVAALALMVWDPFLIFNVGFQLSALGTLGLLAITPRVRAALGRGRLAAAAAVTIGAQLAVNPIIALTFHQASFVAVPANILAVPASVPVMVLGMIGAPLGAIYKPIGRAFALASYPFLRFMELVASSFAHLPGASVSIPPGPFVGVAIVLSILAIIAVMRMTRVRLAPVLLVCVLVAGVITWGHALAPSAPPGLHIIGLKVGYGDSILIEQPDGLTMLIDGGPDPNAIMSELRSHHVRRIDLMVLTHPHADHVTGLISALNQYPVGSEIDAGIPFGPNMSPRFPGYLLLLQQRHVHRSIVRTGSSFDLGEAHFDVLGPTTLFSGTDSDPNNDSVVMRMTYHGTCALLTGDVQREAQAVLLQHPDSLRCPILKAPHHGSGKVLKQFYEATHSRIALVCVGPNNYGHPSAHTMRLMQQLRMRSYRTDINSDVTITIGLHGEISASSAN